jgi:ribokinase
VDLKVAVVGHVEWISFLAVDRPPTPGLVLRAPEERSEAGGGGGVAAAELARLAGAATLVTAMGADARGQAIPAAFAVAGVRVIGPKRPEPHRRAVTLIDPAGERTIVVVGPAQAATGAEVDPAIFAAFDAVYFCKGDAALLRAARGARALVATARVLDVAREAGVRLDALVRSGVDPHERYVDGDLPVPPGLVATTEGASGGAWRTAKEQGRWAAVAPPGPVYDAYGAGDCFAAGLTWALGAGMGPQAAVDFAAGRGAGALCRPGAGVGEGAGGA